VTGEVETLGGVEEIAGITGGSAFSASSTVLPA
jgi:hypothetical protein